MAKELVSDELWSVIEPLLPAHRALPGLRGRPPLPDRAALTGIIFVLKSGIPAQSSLRLLCATFWRRRLRDWHRAGAWQRLHETLLARLEKAGIIDWMRNASGICACRASVDSIHVPC